MFDNNFIDSYKLKSKDIKFFKLNEKILKLTKNYYTLMSKRYIELSEFESNFSKNKKTPLKIIEILESQNSIIKELISIINEVLSDKSINTNKKQIFYYRYYINELNNKNNKRPKTPDKKNYYKLNNCNEINIRLKDQKNKNNKNNKKKDNTVINKYYKKSFLNSFLSEVNIIKETKNNKLIGNSKDSSFDKSFDSHIKTRNTNISSFRTFDAVNTTYDNLMKKSLYTTAKKSRELNVSNSKRKNKKDINLNKGINYNLNKNLKRIYNLSQKIIQNYLNN